MMLKCLFRRNLLRSHCAQCCLCSAQAPAKYEPTLESLDRASAAAVVCGAKLGIFIHWGLYSVPGWAPLTHPTTTFRRTITSSTTRTPSGI